MIGPLFYYIVLPFLLGAYVIKLIKKHGKSSVAPDVAALFASQPLEKRFFRAARRDKNGLMSLGDFEKMDEAVTAAYRAKEQAVAAGDHASFIVVNDQAETLEQIDS